MSEENRVQTESESESCLTGSGCCLFFSMLLTGSAVWGAITGYNYTDGHVSPLWLAPLLPWITGAITLVLLAIFIWAFRQWRAEPLPTAPKAAPPKQQTSVTVKSTSAEKKDETGVSAIAQADRLAREKAREAEEKRKAEQAKQAEAERATREKAREAEEKRKAEQVKQAEAGRTTREKAKQAEVERATREKAEKERLAREEYLAREQAKSEPSSRATQNPPMRDAARESLRQLVMEYGRSICEDPMRCRSLLLDVCGEYRREINVLMAVLEEHVVADLFSPPTGVPRDLFLARLTRRVCENRGLTEEVARWGVQTWVFALGL
jgi:pyruvate/2-oxoglutarate dehydrogenase complex dihydrolipoamide acyltransferase (E2) component